MQETITGVREHGTIEVPLGKMLSRDRSGLDLFPEVTAKGYFGISLRGETVQFRAGSYVGLIPLNDRVAIEVAPRSTVSALARMLRISGRAPTLIERLFRRYASVDDQIDSLTELIAGAFVTAVNEIVHRGMKREYHERAEHTSFPHGRIRIGPTMQNAARGARHRVAISWFEPTPDIAVNRLLKYVLWYLTKQYQGRQRRRGHSALLTDLDRLYRQMEGVELDLTRSFLATPGLLDPAALGSIWAYYLPALHLGMMILKERGVDPDPHPSGPVRLPSMLVKMDDVFEDYLRAVLATGLEGMQVLDGNRRPPEGAAKDLFWDNSSIQATPDMVIERSGAPPIVLEVKYKISPDRSDLNQAVTYGASYAASDVVLVHLGTGGGGAPSGTLRGVTVHSYGFDLSENLGEEERRFVRFVSELCIVAPPT